MAFEFAVLVVAHVVEGVLAETVLGDALHHACGNDAVRVDVGSWDINAGAGDLSDVCECHGARRIEEIGRWGNGGVI